MEELYNQHTSGWAKGKFTWYKDQGFWNNPMAPEGVTWAQENFKARPNDVLLCSCPKSGITWLKALSFAIVMRKTLGKSTNPLLTNLPHVCVPFIDKDTQRLKETLKNSNFPLLATHIPYASLPESVIASNCKIVYIYRNVKDVIVSDYHFLNKIHHIPEEDASFEERFDEFYQGISHYGPYWDHILGYWKAMLERPDRILFLKYEDMKRDPTSNVKRLAEFIGYPFSIEEEKCGVVENIINLCSFQNLSNLEVNKTGKFREFTENTIYFRKGEDGDWKNYFTNEMKEKIDKLIDEKLGHTGLVLK